MSTSHSSADRAPTPAAQPGPAADRELPGLGIEHPAPELSESDVASTSCGNVNSNGNGAAVQNALQNSPKTSGKAGAPAKNVNAIKHGMRSEIRNTFTLAKGNPKVPGESNAKKAASRVRRKLTAELVAKHGSLTVLQQATVNTASRIEECIKQFDHWIAQPGRTEKERLDARARVTEFALSRDRTIERLNGKANQQPAADDWADALADADAADEAPPTMQAAHEETPADSPDAADNATSALESVTAFQK
jgi:hypothetical protein